ncbi:hypothetical protein [Mesorhizobium sp. M0296]|uniref:hypothetical protein n=1 Tax=Mesorhizobium sp. M0296 TaxID=2956931 RepID=UPI0033395811
MADIALPIQTVTAIQLALQNATAPDGRGQHAKMHGCVEAIFRVRSDVPEALKVGLFATPKQYAAAVRFSNGAQRDDRKPDIHGMAIKLFDVHGAKVLESETESLEHDFILADNPVFFIRTAADYVLFMQDFAASAPRGLAPEKFIAYLKDHYPADIPVLLGFRQHLQDNPLTTTYWSQVPYAFGREVICRYRCMPLPAAPPSGSTGPTHDYLRERMVERLGDGQQDIVFEFAVQVKKGADPEVIDNPTIEWPEPFVPVATIHIAAQTFDTGERRQFGDRLSFTPWHALADHQPVGEVNEIRKVVYLASKNVRQQALAIAHDNLRLTEQELTQNIDDEFKVIIDSLQRTFGFLAHEKRGRATHTWGAAGRGTARFIVAAEFPTNGYFVAGKTVPVILRHSSPGAREDDRARDGVAASIKFFPEESNYSGPGELDILMNAGRQLFVRSIRDFSTFVHASPEQRKQLVAQGIMMEPELIEAYRIRGSFLNSRYHSWQCFEFLPDDGVMRYIRFRLIPGDRGPERGLPAGEFRAEGAPSMDPVTDDPRAPDFLRQEWIYQVKYSQVAYILQAQLHNAPTTGDKNPEVLNPAKAWDEKQNPWMDLCEIHIDEPILDRDVASRLDMNPNRSPPCITIPLATSPDQFASLGHARAIVYPGSRAVRAAVEKPENN